MMTRSSPSSKNSSECHCTSCSQNSYHTSSNSSPFCLNSSLKMISFLYIVFLINSFQLVTSRQVSSEHSKYQVNLKCADNLMDVAVKLNIIVNENSSNSKLTSHSTANQTIVRSMKKEQNFTLIKPRNLVESINKTSKVAFKRPIESLKFNNNTKQTNKHSQNASLLTTVGPKSNNKMTTNNMTTNNMTINNMAINNMTTTNTTTNRTNNTDSLTTNKLAANLNKHTNGPIVTETTTTTVSNTHSLNRTSITSRTKRSAEQLDEKCEKYEIQNLRMYLEGWQDIPQCQPEIVNKSSSKNKTNSIEDTSFRFQLVLQPVNDTGLNCGLTKMRNKLTDDLDYQHTIIIEYNERLVDSKKNEIISTRTRKDALLIHCKMPKANFFQTNQLIWWSSRVKQQMLDQQWMLEEQQRLLKERLKQTNRKSDNEQTINEKQMMMTRSDLDTTNTSTSSTMEKRRTEQRLTFDNGQLDKLDLNLSVSSQQNRKRSKRASQQQLGRFLNSLPENFTESVEELIDYSGSYTGTTPVPKIHIAVRQNGNQFINSLDVLPGTPLEMMIYLDDESANVYGLLVSYLKVTDNANKPRQQEEIIILDGCSIDQYIFENFESNDNGKSILAKFRAFRFPGSNYVLFVGTINVCIGQCTPVLCAGSQQYAYGRRRRKRRDLNTKFNNDNNINNQTIFSSTTLPPSLMINNNSDFELKVSSNRRGRKLTSSMQPDVNKIFEVELSTIIRVRKPTEISSLIKNEFATSMENWNLNSNHSSTLIQSSPANKSRVKRPVLVRNIKKRYDSNQSNGKLSHLSYYKQTPLTNASTRLSIHRILMISHFAFSLIFLFLNLK